MMMRSIGVMMCICILIFNISTPRAISLTDIQSLAKAGIVGWDLFHKIFYSEEESEETCSAPTRLLITYQSKTRKRSKFIHFDTKVHSAASEGPLEDVQQVAAKLVKNKKIDVADCDLIYYEFISTAAPGREHSPVDLVDEADLIYLMTNPGDLNKGSVRLIEVFCGAVPKADRPPDVNMKLYKSNERAFEHVIAVQKENRSGSMQKVRTSLNEAGIGGFSVKSKGYAGLDMDEEVFDSYTANLAKAWGWDEKITTQLDMVTSIGRQFSGTFNVWFEPASWKIMGDYQRFASFRTVEDKYSIYVATSKFEYTIPSDQREGDFLDRIGVKGGGAIKGEYFEQVGHLMEGESLERFQIDISKPMLEDYQTYV